MNKTKNPFRIPLPFSIRYLWATSAPFRLLLILGGVAALALVLGTLLTLAASFLAGTATLVSRPGVSTLIGAIVGASVSLVVSISIQREQNKAKSLLTRKDEIYEPLLRSVIAFLHQLDAWPYPDRIAHIGWVSNFSLQPQAGFLEWSEVVSSGRVIYVPQWLRNAFEAMDDNIEEYNTMVGHCSAQIHELLVQELRQAGLIESAGRFSEIGTILSADYGRRVVTPFSSMKHPESRPDPHDEILAALPALFSQYGRRADVTDIRHFYEAEIIPKATWLKSALEHIIRFIELSYGSRDAHV